MSTSTQRLERTRTELAEFLRSRRERISPQEVGLTVAGRRRTPGLRREEVAALSGVGITWYTWLEQGRDIGVSAAFLDDLCKVLKLDAAERRHLYLLTQKRLPKEPARTACTVPPIAHDLLSRLPESPSYVLNLKWDVLAWNEAADRLFAFSDQQAEQRNMLWMVFADERLRARLSPWEEQARQILTSFKRDFAHAPQDTEIIALTENLSRMDPTFKDWWKRQDIDGKCSGRRTFDVEGLGEVELTHMTMTLESDKHLRFVYYTPLGESAEAFGAWATA
ncbi:helix-turn-helix transcriptional regulator [Streptomyces viridosporus]|uniref:helix-turn-helix transcriptional regulator n=1 Tax=Streptomyces viridosporus TaxID=67581 RepID=UPI0033208CA9